MGFRRRPASGDEFGSSDWSNEQDVEKNHLDQRASSMDSDYNDSSTDWSKDTRDSQEAMLRKNAAGKQRPGSLYAYRVPHRIIRWLCLALMCAVILFILTLIRASWKSSRHLEVHILRPPPPAYEKFAFLERYYGGLRSLVPKADNIPEYPREAGAASATTATVSGAIPSSTPFLPYPNYASPEYEHEFGSVHECFLDEAEQIKAHPIHAFPGTPQGMPAPVMGSHQVVGTKDDMCFDRYGKLGPYGFGYTKQRGGVGAGIDGERAGSDEVWREHEEVDYRHVDWAAAQQQCHEKNKHRFGKVELVGDSAIDMTAGPVSRAESSPLATAPKNQTTPIADRKKIARTAIVVRTWSTFEYSPDDVLYLRSLITELSLMSGGEYSIHFLIHVKDDNLAIWADQAIYNKVLNDSLPKGFSGLGTLWSERQMGLIYGGLAESFYRDLPVHGVYRSTFMPIQYFAHQHPEYDYFWNWEMDTRYTGHWYHLMESIRQWSTAQPRKGLWERNGRFYIPDVHGSWEDFKQMVRVQSELQPERPHKVLAGLHSSVPPKSGVPDNSRPEKPIWGAFAHADTTPLASDPTPPTSYEKDKYEWGVGEEADLITLLPIFDPESTDWILAEDVTGYNQTLGLPPRRTAIVTASRLSRRLLASMHDEVALQRHTMFSEMWPASCALHHGLKAVYAPHPLYIDREWPLSYLASIMNGGRNGATGGSKMSVFGDQRQVHLAGVNWYYNGGFGPNLYRRWLGYRINGDGGEEEEVAREGRMCLPAMLLHPIKKVEMIIEGVSD